jgi:hypothetical protein
MQDEYLRVLVAQLHVMLLWTIAREKFGKAVSALSEAESKDVQDMAYAQIRYFAAVITPEKIQEIISPLKPGAIPPSGTQIR